MNQFINRRSAVILLTAVLSTAGLAQSAPPAGSVPQNITGKWSGSFEIRRPDGDVGQGTAVLIIKQSGDTITGTVGPSEDNQLVIKQGKIVGSDIQLNGETEGGAPFTFHLHQEGYHLKGDMTTETPNGKITGKIDVTLQQPSPSSGT